MGFATTIVHPDLIPKITGRDGVVIIRDETWSATERFLEFLHPDAPDGRHVDVILDERGLRFRPDCDV